MLAVTVLSLILLLSPNEGLQLFLCLVVVFFLPLAVEVFP
ncbi:MAG: hypothetical protein ACI9C9_002853 [Marivirga sp.]|jgi:hypothetical protein